MKNKNVTSKSKKSIGSDNVKKTEKKFETVSVFTYDKSSSNNTHSTFSNPDKPKENKDEAKQEPGIAANNLSMDHLVNESMIPCDRRDLISAQLDNGDLILHIIDDLTGWREHVYICPDKAFEKVPEIKKLNRLVRDVPMKLYEQSDFNLLGYSEKFRVSFQLDHMERYHRPEWYQEMDRYIKGETDRFFTKYRRLHAWAKNEAKPPF